MRVWWVWSLSLLAWSAAVVTGEPPPETGGPPGVDLSQPLSLPQCIDIAIANHPSVKAASAGLDSAKHRVTESRAARLPRVDFDSNWSRFESSRQGYAIGRAGASENRETIVSATYTILDSGQRTTAIRQATATANGSQASLESTRQDVALAVVEAYYGLLAAQRLKGLRQKVIASAEQHVAAAQAGFDAGTTARIDILRAQTELANARVDDVAADGTIQRSMATLRNAMGLVSDQPVAVRDEETVPAEPGDLKVAQAEALERRPELRQAESSVESSRQSVRSAKISAGPALSFTGGYDHYLQSTSDITREYVFRATLSYPLFDGKQTRSRVESAQADLVAREGQRERERQSVLLEVERNWIAVRDALARLEATRVAREQADENLRLNEASYTEGVATMVEVIDAQASAAQAEVNQIQARYDASVAALALRYALGRDLATTEVGAP